MPRTVSDLKKAVAGFLNRDQSSFVRETYDILLSACNNARLFVERTVELEMSRVAAQLTVSLASGGALSSTTLAGTATAVAVRSVKSAGLKLTDANIYVPIKIYNRDDYLAKIGRRFADASRLSVNELTPAHAVPFGMFRLGNTIYVVPNDPDAFPSGSTTLYMDVFKWLPEYTAGTENDFLLDYCFDYMIYRTVAELCMFTKEDQRTILSAQAVATAWDSLKAWNAALVQQSDNVSLD